jgi:hypothetical protein
MSKIETDVKKEEAASIGGKLSKLLQGYGDPKSSVRHAELAKEIRQAVKNKDLDDLLEKLEWFGNARCNASPKTQMTEMFCANESYAIIDELKKLENVPWEEISTALGT